MKSVIGVVEQGRIRLPGDVLLPEGCEVFVQWDDEAEPHRPYLEREPLTEEDVLHDIEWAHGHRWSRDPA